MDFGFLSDTDDSAVEELISQTRDLCVLEQVAAINCSGLTNSELPDDLEARFRRLKSFPVAKPNPKIATTRSFDRSRASGYPGKRGYDTGVSPNEVSQNFSLSKRNSDGKDASTKASRCGRDPSKGSVKAGVARASSDEENEVSSDAKQDLDPEMGSKKKSRCENTSNSRKVSSRKGTSRCDDDASEFFPDFERELDVKVSSSSSSSSKENRIFSSSKQSPYAKEDSKPKSKHGSASFLSSSSFSNSSNEGVLSRPKPNSVRKKKSNSKPSSKSFDWSNSGMPYSSPPQTMGCLWCSPKKACRKKKKESKKRSTDFDSDIDDFLSDLNAFPVGEQRKMLRKALEEQQKVRKEAAKILKMSKQASARMNLHGVGDDLSYD